MDFEPTNERQMVIDTVRGFVEKELNPHKEEGEHRSAPGSPAGRRGGAERCQKHDAQACRSWRLVANQRFVRSVAI